MTTNPLFPLEKELQITDKTVPIAQTGSIQVFIQLAEQNLFVQGFEAQQFSERPPTLLRGCLVVRILKSTKLKSISLNFKGISRTDWPEGIPPKKQEFFEENDLINHTWPFYNQNSDNNSSGADIYKPLSSSANHSHSSHINSNDDLSSLSLDNSSNSNNTSSSPFALIKRATSPSPSRSARSRSNTLLASLKATTTNNSLEQSLSNDSMLLNNNHHHFNFQPGDYIYNFEHPIPSSTPETINATFGSVNYKLHVSIERVGAFKSNIQTSYPIRIIRGQSEESVEDSEPIAISRYWEDQLHYDIIIASKALILNAYLPISFKLIPLDKIKLHRIRIYLTENTEYYCRNKKVHRMEPVKKFLLLEHRAPPPPDLPADADPKQKKMGNLLSSDGYDLIAKEFDFQIYVPKELNSRQSLHPNTSYSNIKSHHWIKICLRLSRTIDDKPKHYEISIDSPIHVLDPLCSHANTLLPAYGLNQTQIENQPHHDSNIYFPKEILSSPPVSPDVVPVDNTLHSIYQALNSDHRPRAMSNPDSVSSSIRQSSPYVQTFESSLSANVYKPDHLQLELTSPQAIPVSPTVSPISRPFYSLGNDISPPPFNAEISPPPMRDLLNQNIDDIIDLDNAPKNPPPYDEVLKDMNNNPNPQIVLTSAAKNNDDTRVGRKRNDDSDDGDLGSSFQFKGTSPNMPASVMRATSPDTLRVKSAATSPRHSIDLNRRSISGDTAAVPAATTTTSTKKSPNVNNIQDIDSVLRGMTVGDSSAHNSNNSTTNGSANLNKLSRASSISSTPDSVHSFQGDSENEIVDMEPLLQTVSTTNSYLNSSFSRRGSTNFRNQSFDHFQSKESLINHLNREPSSVDITALYSSQTPNYWHPFQEESNPNPTLNSPSSSRFPISNNNDSSSNIFNNFQKTLNGNTNHNYSNQKRPSFGVQSPILSTLSNDQVSNQSSSAVTTPTRLNNNLSSISDADDVPSSILSNNSISTLTNVNEREDSIINKHTISTKNNIDSNVDREENKVLN